MEIEEKSQKRIDDSKSAIAEAQNIMAEMALMRKKLNIKEGAGHRFLQKTKPEQAVLEQAEKVIDAEYSNNSGIPKSKKKNRKNLMNALARHGRA